MACGGTGGTVSVTLEWENELNDLIWVPVGLAEDQVFKACQLNIPCFLNLNTIHVNRIHCTTELLFLFLHFRMTWRNLTESSWTFSSNWRATWQNWTTASARGGQVAGTPQEDPRVSLIWTLAPTAHPTVQTPRQFSMGVWRPFWTRARKIYRTRPVMNRIPSTFLRMIAPACPVAPFSLPWNPMPVSLQSAAGEAVGRQNNLSTPAPLSSPPAPASIKN